MRIDRCVCKERFFESLIAEARVHGWSLEELMERTGAGRECGSCAQYLCCAHRTGQTVFFSVLPAAPPKS